MSGNTEATANESTDLTALSLDDLRAKFDDLTGHIDTLSAKEPSVETAQQIRELRLARNKVATAAKQVMAAQADEAAAEAAAEDVDGPVAEAADVVEDVVVEDVVADAETVSEEAAAVVAEAEQIVETAVGAIVETAGETAIAQNDSANHVDGGPTVADNPAPSTETVVAAEAIVAEGTAVTASVDRPLATTEQPAKPVVSFQAGPGQSQFTSGQNLSIEDVGIAMQTSKRRTGTKSEGIVASLPSFEKTPGMEGMVLNSRASAADNTALVSETVELWRAARRAEINGEAPGVTAAICTPLDVIREIPACGVTDSPVSDLFPQRGVGRLGFQYFPAPALADASSHIAMWDQTDQDSVDENDTDTWKPAPIIECAPAVSVTADEIVGGAQVDDAVQLSQPEVVEAVLAKIAVARARTRESYLLGRVDATASAYSFAGAYGALTSLIATSEIMPIGTYAERIDAFDYDLVLEPGHMQKLIIDEMMRGYGDPSSAKARVLEAIKNAFGVGRVVETLDLVGGGYSGLATPGNAAVALPSVNATNRVRIVPSGAYLFGSTGEQATGWQTDPQLARQNRTQWFSKEWLFLTKHGCSPAITIDITSCANGDRAFGSEIIECPAS